MRENAERILPSPTRQPLPKRGAVVSGTRPRRVGVIGAGLISQAMHLPHLALLRDRFELAVVADPSRTVRERVGDRFGIPRAGRDRIGGHRPPGLEGVVVGTPNATHASIVLEALAAGLDVFVEKPLAISLEDVDAIVEAQRASGRVVQVGYNNRFDRSYERLVSELPASADGLRYVSVLMHDPEFGPYFGAEDLARGSDVPADVIEQTRADEAAQVKQAVGVDDDGLDRGVLGRLPRQPDPPGQHGARDARADGRAAAAGRHRRRRLGRRPGACRVGAALERRPLGQRVDPAPRHARVRGVDPALLRRRGADARDPVAVAAPVAERLLGHDGRRRRQADGPVRVVRGGLPARARALPPVHARRRGVPDAAGPGADRPGRPDRDVPQARDRSS